MAKQRTLVVIPARYESERLPGKVLRKVGGKPLLQYVCERAKGSKLADRILVATDSPLVESSAHSFGAEVVLTSHDHKNGTERVAEVASLFADYPLVVNLQGDEPEMPSSYLDRLIEFLSSHTSFEMATLAAPVKDTEEVESPDNVKVVFDRDGKALYFSRSPLPYPRKTKSPVFYRHIGIYGFRREFLLQLVSLSPTPLEQAESLEQLRALEHGKKIGVSIVDFIPAGIDTESDLAAFRERMENK